MKAYLQERPSDDKTYIFGLGNIPMIKQQFGIKNSFEIPLRSHISKYSDAGAPVVLALPKDDPIPDVFRRIAENLDKECDALEKQGSQVPIVRYQTGASLVIVRTYVSVFT